MFFVSCVFLFFPGEEVGAVICMCPSNNPDQYFCQAEGENEIAELSDSSGGYGVCTKVGKGCIPMSLDSCPEGDYYPTTVIDQYLEELRKKGLYFTGQQPLNCLCQAKDGTGTICIPTSDAYVGGCGPGCSPYYLDCIFKEGNMAAYHCNCQDGCKDVTIDERNPDHGACEKLPNCAGVSPQKGACGGGISTADVKQQLSYLNPAKFSDPSDIIGRALKFLIYPIGSIAIALFVYAGFLWMTASGNQEQINKSKRLMFWTAAGIAIMLASYMITKAVMDFLTR